MGGECSENHPAKSKTPDPWVSHTRPISDLCLLIASLPYCLLHFSRLVLQVRDPITPIPCPTSFWNQINPDDIIYPEHTMDLELYPLHNLIGITGEKLDDGHTTEKLVLRQQLAELRKRASRWCNGKGCTYPDIVLVLYVWAVSSQHFSHLFFVQ